MVEGGCIVESGTYDELKKREGFFTEFVRTHLNEQDEKIIDAKSRPIFSNVSSKLKNFNIKHLR